MVQLCLLDGFISLNVILVDKGGDWCSVDIWMLRKEPNGQREEPNGHRSVKIKDLRVSWKWPVCDKVFRYGKGVRKLLYQSQLQQSLQPQKYKYKCQYKKNSCSHARNTPRLV